MSTTPLGPMGRKRKPPGATSRGGWGHVHQQRRKRWEPQVAARPRTGFLVSAGGRKIVDMWSRFQAWFRRVILRRK
jgi:hypothetical protein